MYDFLEGQVASRRAASLTLNVGGIGFELRVPLGVPMPPPGERARLYTHLAVREDAHTLYGSPIWRPATSSACCSRCAAWARAWPWRCSRASHATSSSKRCCATTKTLQGIKGVGKKTAEQILPT
ncbi:MAG: OB-fold domain-containing protein [Planctomycetota bacterium]